MGSHMNRAIPAWKGPFLLEFSMNRAIPAWKGPFPLESSTDRTIPAKMDRATPWSLKGILRGPSRFLGCEQQLLTSALLFLCPGADSSPSPALSHHHPGFFRVLWREFPAGISLRSSRRAQIDGSGAEMFIPSISCFPFLHPRARTEPGNSARNPPYPRKFHPLKSLDSAGRCCGGNVERSRVENSPLGQTEPQKGWRKRWEERSYPPQPRQILRGSERDGRGWVRPGFPRFEPRSAGRDTKPGSGGGSERDGQSDTGRMSCHLPFVTARGHERRPGAASRWIPAASKPSGISRVNSRGSVSRVYPSWS